MAETGCLRDFAVQNLQVANNVDFLSTYSFSQVVSTGDITVGATAADDTAVATTADFTQPANTILKNIYIRNAGAGAVTITGHADDAGVTLQVGTAADTDLLLGPATAAVGTGNIIDGATANDAQSWPANGVGYILTNGVGAGANAHTGLNADLDSIAITLSTAQRAAFYTATSRTLRATITSITATQANAPVSAATWRVYFEFQSL